MTVRNEWKTVFKGRRGLAVGALVLGLTLAGLGWVRFTKPGSGSEVTLLETERSNLVVSVEESGTLKPVTETTIRNGVHGTSRIIYLVPEGSMVEEGDLLVELDASGLEDHVERRLLSHERRQATHASAQSRLVIAKSDAESKVRKAQLKVDFARMDMEKFEKLERSHLVREAEMDVMLARESLKIAEERFQNSRKLTAAGFETESTLNRDRLAVTTDSVRLEKALGSEEVEKRFDLVKRYEKLSANLIETQKELMRTKRETEGRVIQAEEKLRSAEASMEVSALALEEARAQLSSAKIHAPHAGMVVYGGSGSRATRESMIEEGAMVRDRQELITIPDLSSMKIAVKIHETLASDVQPGQDALITLDSDPERIYRGEVSHVALFPDRQNFWSASKARVYSAEITITDPVVDINPGASGKAQIILHYLEDVVTVPIDAVTTIEGQQIIEVQSAGRKTETRPVEIGVFNERRVHVLSGLEPGEVVVVRDAS